MTDEPPPDRKAPPSSTARLPSPQSGDFAMARRAEITRRVASEFPPASAEVIEQAVALVPDGFGKRTVSPMLAKAYILGLEGIAAAGIELGVLRVLQAEAGLNTRFRPNPAELAKVCKAADRDLRLHRAAEVQAQLPPRSGEWEPSLEERRRVSAEMAALRGSLATPGPPSSERLGRQRSVAPTTKPWPGGRQVALSLHLPKRANSSNSLRFETRTLARTTS